MVEMYSKNMKINYYESGEIEIQKAHTYILGFENINELVALIKTNATLAGELMKKLEQKEELGGFEYDVWMYKTARNEFIEALGDVKLERIECITKDGDQRRYSILVKAPREPEIRALTDKWQIKNVFVL